MAEEKIYTWNEANNLVDELKKVFPVVRILKGSEVGGLADIKDGSKHVCRCFEFWGKSQPCENCISIKTLKDHNDRTKIEYLDDTPYQVFSKYMNIEGQECVLEVLKDIINLNIDPDDLRHLGDKILNIDDKLYKDTLTGAFNRAYYDERKEKTIDSAGVVFLDVDDFKNINDIFGHGFGDVVLKAVADVLFKNVRSDDVVIRYGGDEFIILLPHITRASLLPKLERIRTAVNNIILPEHNKVRISVSIGATICESEKLNLACKRADKLMYSAKQFKNKVNVDWETSDNGDDEISEENKLLILIVDDSEINRFMLKSMLEDKYRILEAADGKEATKIVGEYLQNISLILLDIEMPNMGGFEFLSFLRLNDLINDIPVIMISSDNNEDVILRAYELGAIDYITRPYNARIVLQRVSNISRLYLRQRKFKEEIRQQINKNDATSKMMSVIYSYVVGYRNHESGPHILRVEQITEILLNEVVKNDSSYYFTEDDKKNIIAASGMHDIGKIAIDEKILNKPGKLTTEEYEIMKTHTTIGAKMLMSMEIYRKEPLVNYAYKICRWHHERFDGGGYPDGLCGAEIPIEAQIVSIADVYDALVSQRVYKGPYTHEDAIRLIQNGDCGVFNPFLVKCLMEVKETVRKLYDEEVTSYSGGGTLDNSLN